jgi:DNA primase
MYGFYARALAYNHIVIPQSFIQDLLNRVDVVDVVGRYVKLKKGGANLMGLCPFHGEKSPSFSVSPTKQFYHCFGCGAHGSAIGFLMEYAGLGYVDAVKDLAASVGLQVPHEQGDDQQTIARNQDAAALLEAAAKFYRSRLKDADHAIAYLKGRGLTGQTAARFGIGYAPAQWRGLEAAVNDYANEALITAGLVIEAPPEEQGKAKRYDRFRDRIMFPIRNPKGQVIGFGGRILDKGEPKYLNSPETPLFVKGRELYGLFEARDALRKQDCAIVVEGYMDVVMLAQHGIDYAVATLGTATTPEHLKKLLRIVDRVVFCFDGDGAGKKAAWRALEAALPLADDAKQLDFLFLPAEHDPDTYVQTHGLANFQAMLGKATPLSVFLIDGLMANNDTGKAEGRARLLAQAKPLLGLLPPGALRLQLEHELGRITGLAATEVQGLLVPTNKPALASLAPANPQAVTRKNPARPLRPSIAPQKLPRILAWLAQFPDLAGELDVAGLDGDLPDFVARLAACPPGTSWAAVSELAQAEFPHFAQVLNGERAAFSASADISTALRGRPDLTRAEVLAELQGALGKLRREQLARQITGLRLSIAQGSASSGDRQLLASLEAQDKALRLAALPPK